jgi:hypothetical protein
MDINLETLPYEVMKAKHILDRNKECWFIIIIGLRKRRGKPGL